MKSYQKRQTIIMSFNDIVEAAVKYDVYKSSFLNVPSSILKKGSYIAMTKTYRGIDDDNLIYGWMFRQ
jgi:hypothetical protein